MTFYYWQCKLDQVLNYLWEQNEFLKLSCHEYLWPITNKYEVLLVNTFALVNLTKSNPLQNLKKLNWDIWHVKKIRTTSVHSSTSRAAHLLTVSRSSIHILGKGCLPSEGGLPSRRGRGGGCLPSEGEKGSALPWHCGNADLPLRTDRHRWKHCLPHTSYAVGNNK